MERSTNEKINNVLNTIEHTNKKRSIMERSTNGKINNVLNTVEHRNKKRSLMDSMALRA